MKANFLPTESSKLKSIPISDPIGIAGSPVYFFYYYYNYYFFFFQTTSTKLICILFFKKKGFSTPKTRSRSRSRSRSPSPSQMSFSYMSPHASPISSPGSPRSPNFLAPCAGQVRLKRRRIFFFFFFFHLKR
mgnify:CR=1 FL=1